MRTVWADIEEVELEGDYGDVEGVTATCKRCGHETESFGTDEPSVKRCLALLREECPRSERNFYIADETNHQPRGYGEADENDEDFEGDYEN